MTPLRICVVSTPVFALPLRGYGGLEQIAWETAKGLAAKGHQVALVAPEGSECPGVQIISNGPEKTWDEKAAYNLYWQYLPQFDVILDHSWAKWSYILKQEGALKAPILGVMHAPVNTMYQSLPPGVDKPCFVCISEDQANHFMALHSREAKVCYNGIDLGFYRSMGLQRSTRFLFLARFSSIKGADHCIRACKEAGVSLDLVGDTSITNEPQFYKECEAMADGEQIRIIGPCSRGEAVWWYSQAYCMIHANERFREPYGLAPVESMACGTPVLAWNFGAMRETVGLTGKNMLVLSYPDLVKRVAEVRDMPAESMESLRQISRDVASKFSIQRMVDRYHDLCVEAVESGGW